jgi:hypothetical protein
MRVPQVLRFKAFFREELPATPLEPWRVRRCCIHL